MARTSELLQRRDADIRKDYDRYRSAKEGKRQRYTSAYIIEMLSEKYYLSQRRIEDILFSGKGKA